MKIDFFAPYEILPNKKSIHFQGTNRNIKTYDVTIIYGQ